MISVNKVPSEMDDRVAILATNHSFRCYWKLYQLLYNSILIKKIMKSKSNGEY